MIKAPLIIIILRMTQNRIFTVFQMQLLELELINKISLSVILELSHCITITID